MIATVSIEQINDNNYFTAKEMRRIGFPNNAVAMHTGKKEVIIAKTIIGAVPIGLYIILSRSMSLKS